MKLSGILLRARLKQCQFRDSGLLHALLGIRTRAQLESHPRYGASWEGFALEQTLARFGEFETLLKNVCKDMTNKGFVIEYRFP